MNITAQFIRPELLLKLSDREIRTIGAIIDAEITGNPDIKAAINKRLAEIEPHIPLEPKKK